MKHPEYEEFGFEWVDEMYPTNEEDENMSECAKRGCCYYWQDEDEAYPRCHWECHCPGDMAPCEYESYVESHYADDPEDWEESDNWDDEIGFDPYEGCCTWDC